MEKVKIRLLYTTVVFSLLYFTALAFNVSPYLRGFALFPQWQWGYEFINTTSRLWFPLGIILVLISSIYYVEKKKESFILKHEKYLLLLIVLLGFILQIALLYYSRGGLLVLVQRLLLPNVSGYFSTAQNIHNISDFLYNFPKVASTFPNFAQWHPPGSILLFWLMNRIFSFASFLHPIINSISPNHADVKNIWGILSPEGKMTALFAGYLFIFLACLTSIPVYYIGKILYGVRVGLRSALFYIFIPGIALFAPLDDIYFSLLVSCSFLFFIQGIKKRNSLLLIISGVFFFLGVFFTLSTLTVLFIFFTFAMKAVISEKNVMRQAVYISANFIFGLLFLPFLLNVSTGFQSISTIEAVLRNHYGISHLRTSNLWLFYNFYDFFMFFSIPLLIPFLTFSIKTVAAVIRNRKFDLMFFSFIVLTLIVDISKSMNGETGRTWMILSPFILVPLVNYITQLRNSKKIFFSIIVLQTIQILIMTSFIVAITE